MKRNPFVLAALFCIYATTALASGMGLGAPSWGGITGTLSNQADLQSSLDSKLATPGAWTTPTFDNTNFTAAGAMTWTVEAADIDAFAYQINGKIMTVAFTIKATSIGGTPDTEVYILIPASKTATKLIYNVCSILDGGVWALGRVYVAASGTVIKITRMDNAAFTASTNTTRVFGQITFEIN